MVARWDTPGRRQRLARRRLAKRTTAAAVSNASDEPGTPPQSDYRFVDRLDYMLNGAGFTYDHVGHLWLVDAVAGAATA